MRACASVNGGVIFVADEIEREKKTVSYNEFVEQEAADEKPTKKGLFGKRKAQKSVPLETAVEVA